MNYLDHFGLTERPFNITPDTAFACHTSSHQEALNTLVLALDGGEGFIKITGEVGTGKTLLCRRLLAATPAGVMTAYLPNPYLTPRSLMLALAGELRIAVSADTNDHRLLLKLNSKLLENAVADRRVVVCIDEAQAMPLETLECLRLLSNLETEKSKLLQIVLFGQPELDVRLQEPSVRQLRQRIAFHYELRGLSKEEVAAYTAHRLRVAGLKGEPIMSGGAIRALYRASRGTPRLINILAHKALLVAFGEGRHRVRFGDVRLAAKDTEGVKWVWWW